MSVKITMAEFETLPDSLKAKFKVEGEEYILPEEDVDGLKKSKAEILSEKKKIENELAELKTFKAEHEAKESEVNEAKLKEAGAFKELEEKLRARIVEVEADRDARIVEIMGNLKIEQLKNLVIEKGVLPNRAKYALMALKDQFELESGDSGFSLKLKTGIGDPKEINGAIEELKKEAGFLFASVNASGSGASGSQSNGGMDAAKQINLDAYRNMDSAQQLEFAKAGGKVID